MTHLRRFTSGVLIFGGTAIAIASCAQDARDFTPVDGGGEGGQDGVGASGTGGSSTGGEGGDGPGTGGSGTGGNGTGGDGTGGDGSGGGGTCTDELPSGDECGGTCEPCPDGLSCDDADDCEGDVCTEDGLCCTTALEPDLCEGKCGMLDNCGDPVTCATCVGEAMCSDENVCGCPARPCAIVTDSFGNANQEYIAGLAVDSAGNLYMVGDYSGTLQFGDLPPLTSVVGSGTVWEDMFLVKFDPMGNALWAKSFGDGSDQEARGVATDGAGNVVLIGRSSGTVNFGDGDLVTSSDMVIAKFNGDGVVQFSDAYGEYNAHAEAVAIEPATGEIVVTGHFFDNLTFGTLQTLTSTDTAGGHYDIFVVRFNAAGVPQYSRSFGSGIDEYPQSTAIFGNYAYVTGSFAGAFTFGGPNEKDLVAVGGDDLFVAKLGKASFSHVWSHRFGGPTGESGVGTPRLVVDPPSGDVFVAGNFWGSLNLEPALTTDDQELYLARLDADDGASLWAEQYANADLGALALGPDGHLYLAGTATGDVDFGGGTRPFSGTRDVFIAKLTLSGDHVYSRVFSSPTGDQLGQHIAVTQGREAWIGSRFNGQLQFGMDPLQAQGGYDIAIGKYAP